ncbi:MAG: DegV family protein [Clostridiales bacterium]|nr:DegV family protein [Clostridiales bacterium]
MNNDYVIFTDASADVMLDISGNSDLHFIEMPCESDGNIYNCTGTDSDEKIKQFYVDIRSGSLPKTTQITPFRYEEIFTPFLEDGKDIICLCLSSGLSSTFESSKLAAENLNAKYENAKLYTIDSIGATGAMSILVERMLANRDRGLTAAENAADIEEFKHHIYTTCYVEDLHHLKRGGRIGAAAAVIGSLLNLKPIIRITEDGRIESTDKCRGAKKAVLYIVDKYKELADMDDPTPIYVCDADNQVMADFMEEELKKVNPNVVVHRSRLSPIIGTHLGPESTLISFVKKK